jgi:large subunit ribosomal protein L22
MKALLSNYRQSPRKVRLVANLVKGKSVSFALDQLEFLSKKASLPVKKLIESAVANAKNIAPTATIESLAIESITVNKGLVMKRMMPRAKGSSSPIRKKCSHVVVTLKHIV